MRKKDIQKLYRLDPEMDLKGRIKEKPTYIGGFYLFQDERFQPKTVAMRLMACAVLEIIIFIVAALPDSIGLRQMYVALPYICLFLPYAYMVMAAISQFTVKEKMTEVEYANIVTRTIRSSMGTRVILIICIIADMVVIILKIGDYVMWEEILFEICCISTLLLNEFRLKYMKALNKKLTFCKQEE